MVNALAFLAQTLMWLSLAMSPILGSALIALLACIAIGEINIPLIAACLSLGLIVGVRWAEKVRRGVGLSYFFGRLLGGGKG